MLSPAWTGSGESDLVTERSAAVEASTLVVAVALSLSGFLSQVSLDTLAVLLITVPAGVSALTFTTRMNVALAPLANVSAVAGAPPAPPGAGVVGVYPRPRSSMEDATVGFGR